MEPFWETTTLRKGDIDIIQVNLGNRCNQACRHCHVGASPRGDRVMDEATAVRVCEKLVQMRPRQVEFTGGTPEMNPHFPYFLERLSAARVGLAARTSLTVLDEEPYRHFLDLYRRYRVKVIASLPSLHAELTDEQRGPGTFEKSLRVLRKLNEHGYGNGEGLELELVYNPTGAFLPPSQQDLENKFRKQLGERYQVRFNHLAALTNSPSGRFRRQLEHSGELDRYLATLRENFRPENVARLMCRHLVTVDWQGRVYDCDFNLVRGMVVAGCEERFFWDIDFDDFHPTIACDEHCWACAAASGSSCQGQLEEDFDATEVVRRYYGEQLTSTADLKTSCCTASPPPPRVRRIIDELPDEILARFYGCGSPVPHALTGLTVLDLGCGSGRDSYVLARLVGPQGRVIGIDMTVQQLEVARRYQELMAKRFGYDRPNTEFILDRMENIGRHLAPGSVDLVVSNCVINLVADKLDILRQVFELLRPGGEMYFSDVYCDRRLPEQVRTDPVLYGECLGGALYFNDFVSLARRVGFADPRVAEKSYIALQDNIRAQVGAAQFCSATVRLWKIAGLEERCEDYGHVATYLANLEDCPGGYPLDSEHFFEPGRPERVCGNTALMLSRTRLAPYFRVEGSFERHFGEFTACGTTAARKDGEPGNSDCGCC